LGCQRETPTKLRAPHQTDEVAAPFVAFPDDTKGWVSLPWIRSRKLKERDSFDAILSSSPPITCNLIAARAKELLGVPWLPTSESLESGYVGQK